MRKSRRVRAEVQSPDGRAGAAMRADGRQSSTARSRASEQSETPPAGATAQPPEAQKLFFDYFLPIRAKFPENLLKK